MNKGLLLLLFVPFAVFPHHPSGNPGLQTFDPITGRQKPGNYLVLSEEVRKGALGYRDEYITSVFMEKGFLQGKAGINLLLSQYYFSQKERADAARIGKIYLGGRYSPFAGKYSFFSLVLDGNIGIPFGSNAIFTGGNYYTLSGGMTSVTSYADFIVSARIQGMAPLGRDSATDNEGTRILLKKTSAGMLSAGYKIKQRFVFSLGYFAQKPYYGMEKKDSSKSGKEEVPDHSIYREYLAGVSVAVNEKFTFLINYKRPVYRNEFKPYDSSLVFSLVMVF